MSDSQVVLGFRVDNYFVMFPEDEAMVIDTPNGMAVNVQMHRILEDGELGPVEYEQDVPEEVMEKIQTFLDKMLGDALQAAMSDTADEIFEDD